MNSLWLCFALLGFGQLSLATTLYNGAQKQLFSSNITDACDAAFNTTIDCPENVIQYVTYPIQSVNWNTSWMNDLCTSECKSSLAALATAVDTNCKDNFIVDNQNWTFPYFMSHFEYKYDLICLADESTNEYCLDVEASWNITEMMLVDEASWPTYTNKCYYDASEGYWEYVVDVDGTCLSPFDFTFENASSMAGLGKMEALDYYLTRPDPIDDDNYGWYEPLEYDEYPLEIQCSSCSLQKFRYGLESPWGDVWEYGHHSLPFATSTDMINSNLTAQIWTNMQANCGWSNLTISPANDYSAYETADIIFDTDPGPVTDVCPQTLNVTGFMNMTCQEATVYFQVPSAGLMNLNNDLNCMTLINRTICAPLSCPITTVDIDNNIITVAEWVARYANFTLTQFLTWNPYIGLSIMAHGDTVCSGPPGGAYVVPFATASVKTIYTTAATPTSPVPSGTTAECGLYYTVASGDDCALICEAYSLTLDQFKLLNPSINATCGNLLAGDDYCVAPINGTYVTTTTPTTTISTTASFVTPPSATVTGTTSECYQYYEAQAGDSCDSIESKYGLTQAEFIALNTYIDSSCSNLWPGYSYCVAGIPLANISSSITATATTTTTGEVTTPTPTQTGMVTGCTSFYEAQSGDGCWAIAVDHGITQAEFIEWNPDVGSDCSGLWPDYYYCVAV